MTNQKKKVYDSNLLATYHSVSFEEIKGKQLEVHSELKDVPEHTKEEFEALELNILENGMETPIIISEKNEIIDGRARWNIYLNNSSVVIPKCVIYKGDKTAITALIFSKNITRRHLTQSQKACIATMEYHNILQDEDNNYEGRLRDNLSKKYGISSSLIQMTNNIYSSDKAMFNNVLDGSISANKANTSLKNTNINDDLMHKINNILEGHNDANKDIHCDKIKFSVKTDNILDSPDVDGLYNQCKDSDTDENCNIDSDIQDQEYLDAELERVLEELKNPPTQTKTKSNIRDKIKTTNTDSTRVSRLDDNTTDTSYINYDNTTSSNNVVKSDTNKVNNYPENRSCELNATEENKKYNSTKNSPSKSLHEQLIAFKQTYRPLNILEINFFELIESLSFQSTGLQIIKSLSKEEEQIKKSKQREKESFEKFNNEIHKLILETSEHVSSSEEEREIISTTIDNIDSALEIFANDNNPVILEQLKLFIDDIHHEQLEKLWTDLQNSISEPLTTTLDAISNFILDNYFSALAIGDYNNAA